MGFQVTAQPIAPPYSNEKRILYSLFWAIWTGLLGMGSIAILVASPLAGLVGLGLAVAAGRYAYRIWTYQAKSLWSFFIF
jgi:hypothetical protein